MNHLFSPELIPDYMHTHGASGVKRVLTYTVFRFLSFAGKENDTLAAELKETLFPLESELDFAVIEEYLAADLYFSPSLEENSFDAFFLYSAISMVDGAFDEFSTGDDLAIVDRLILSCCPVVSSIELSDPAVMLDAVIQNGADFYAGLYLALTRYSSALGTLLPQFSRVYREEYHFTDEDTILFDFMDEYFETKNCILQSSYMEMIDTLVQATLGYYKTDWDALLRNEIPAMLNGSASRLAMMKRFGSMQFSDLPEHTTACFMLQEMFRYAAAYELRSNLFDYHLEEDQMITLENWKEKLRWHYVQYANVFEPALDAFFGTVLSQKLLKAEFKRELDALGF